jgi:hypothetical protein
MSSRETRSSSTIWSRALAMPFLVGWILGGIFSLVGIIVSFAAGGPAVRYVASYSWPTVQGTLTDATVTTAPARRSRSVLSSVRVEGTFRYDDRDWALTRHDIFGIGDPDPAPALRRVEELRTNRDVLVLVDPNNPERSVLTRGTVGVFLLHSIVFLFPLIGFLALGITGLSFAFVESGRPRRGFLGWWGGLGDRIIKGPGLEKWTIRLLVFIPLTMILMGIYFQNAIVVVLGLFIGYSVWQASKPKQSRRRR